MQFNTKVPIYLQILDQIKYKILRKEYRAGSMTPSVRALAAEYNVTNSTIQRVMFELVRERLLIPARGVGYYVTDDKNLLNRLKEDAYKEKLSEFFQELKNLGISKTELLTIIKPYSDQWDDLHGRD
jgi:GntR family transcriptional regulator